MSTSLASARTLTADEIANLLKTIPKNHFTAETIGELLRGIDVASIGLDKYCHWRRNGYSRNLVYRDSVFELMVLCWDVGARSAIHDHAGQDCWLYVFDGTLTSEPYALSDPSLCGAVGEGITVHLEGEISQVGVGRLDHRSRQHDLHRIANPFDRRALSLHVYANPIDECIVYQRQGAYKKPLRYDTIEGFLN